MNFYKIIIFAILYYMILPAWGQDTELDDVILDNQKIILPERFNSVKSKTFELYIDIDNYTHPIKSSRITSHFGYRDIRLTSIYEVGIHRGIDIAADSGTPVYAIFDGKVRISQYGGGYGNVVVIRHKEGLESLYAHLKLSFVGENQIIKSGDCIGLCGSTGTRSTGSHLHFELSIEQGRFNPELIIDFKNQCIKK